MLMHEGATHGMTMVRTQVRCSVVAVTMLASACFARVGFVETSTGAPGDTTPNSGSHEAEAVALRLTGSLSADVGVPLTVRIEALDSTDTRVLGYTGTVVLTSTDPAATLAAATELTTSDAGKRDLPSAVAFGNAGTQVLTASDGTRSGELTVVVIDPGGGSPAVAALHLTGATTAEVGTPLTLTVEAIDSAGARVANYVGTVALTSSDAAAILAPAAALTATDAGWRQIPAGVAFGTTGGQIVTASDGTFSVDLNVAVQPAPPATALVRSVGPGRTGPLPVYGEVAILGTTATFNHGVLLDVGVGDAVQYDSDDDGVVDALAFVYGRTSEATLEVHDAAGAPPAATVVPDADYAILRAYTSLADALAGNENVGIDAGLRDFDRWSGGRDAVANHERWTYALYDGAIDTTPVSTAGWTTNTTYCLRLHTPTAATDVGRSQRHDGVWTSFGYRLAAAGADGAVSLPSGCVQLEGLQIENSGAGGTGAGIDSSAHTLVVRDVILRSAGAVHGSLAAGVAVRGGTHVTVANTVAYRFDHGLAVRAVSPGAEVLLYANTVVDAVASGIVLETGGATGVTFGLKNNLVHHSATADFSLAGAPSIDSAGNVSSDATSPQATLRARTVQFVDAAAEDYQLAQADTGAVDLGADLSTDTTFTLTHDIAR
ncbi:MAG: right-handed parallel beta-helix repeat-containing protein, partial [Myxococcota bacterium]